MSRVGGRGADSFLSPELQRQSIERVCQREGLTLVDAGGVGQERLLPNG
ncbi:MAG: hypothetical protein H0U30_02665 [Actinobacteria bacterium]|nr:hypothetical protein [Actinomycetota bacterium]